METKGDAKARLLHSILPKNWWAAVRVGPTTVEHDGEDARRDEVESWWGWGHHKRLAGMGFVEMVVYLNGYPIKSN